MDAVILISLIVLALMVAGLTLFAVFYLRKSRVKSADAEQEKKPEGSWMGAGIGIGVALGVALGTAMDNLGVGIAIGIAIGAGIGAAMERRNAENLRPLTDQETKLQRWGVIIGMLIVLTVFGLLAVFLLMKQ